ncbi:MAG: lipid A deacylase LpxR family protein [Gammaproteobacteria bacterium]|nr:lipid A deacylase LpxR family protein [Gammaproteobacteria bacterium]
MPPAPFLIFALAAACVTVQARAAAPPPESWTATLHFENDLFADTDRFYTNGIKLGFVSPDLKWFQDLEFLRRDHLPARLANGFINLLPWSDDPERQRNVSLSVGQLMFTPRDIARADLIREDRPYAGWLYGSAAFHSKTYRRLDTFELQAGFTGPWSLAEHAQDLVHDLRGIDRARGWGNQIDTELGVALIYDRRLRVLPRRDFAGQWGVDAVVHGGAAAGTVFTHASLGAEARFGWNLPTDFGTGIIRPAGQVDMPTDTRDPRYQETGETLSAYVFAAVAGRWVLRDVFLDGNTFENSHDVDKEPLVGDVVLGASLIWRRFKLSYSHVLRSDEFEGQRGSQQFGSVSISFTY